MSWCSTRHCCKRNLLGHFMAGKEEFRRQAVQKITVVGFAIAVKDIFICLPMVALGIIFSPWCREEDLDNVPRELLRAVLPFCTSLTDGLDEYMNFEQILKTIEAVQIHFILAFEVDTLCSTSSASADEVCLLGEGTIIVHVVVNRVMIAPCTSLV